MTGPLHGIKIVEMSVALTGPLAVGMLVDQGVDAIKVEQPGFGDQGRNDAEFRGFARAFGVDSSDPRVATTAERWANMDVTKEINRRIHAACADIPIQEGARRMEAEDVPFGIVLEVEEVADDPQVHHNELLVEHDHPLMGRIRQPRPPARFGGTPPAAIREPSAPALGQHTHVVLTEDGWGDRIDELNGAGVIQ